MLSITFKARLFPYSILPIMRQVLHRSFFKRPTINVAESLLGKYLLRRIRSRETALPITEVEAYDGFDDRASHGSRGETVRNRAMFEEGGVWYIYFVYGLHHMLNIVVGEKGYPAAILIRAAGEIKGPGKLTKFLNISRTLNGKIAAPPSGVWIEDRGFKVSKREIRRLPRVGVEYAGPQWSRELYRFLYCSQ